MECFMSPLKVRPVKVRLELEAVIDDGEILSAVSSGVVEVPAALFGGFDLGRLVADMQGRVDAEASALAAEGEAGDERDG